MADLNVQPKKRAPIWPWMLLLLIIAVAAYFFLRERDALPENMGSDSTSLHRTDTANQYSKDSADPYRTEPTRNDTMAR